MKIRNRIWALLLSAALMITLLPAMAFAEDTDNGTAAAAAAYASEAAVPVSASWTGPYKLRGVIGEVSLQNLETPDLAAFEVEFSNGDKKEYTYLADTDGTGNFYLTKVNGEAVTADRSDPLQVLYACLDDWTERAHVFMDGVNSAVIEVDIPYYIDKDGNVLSMEVDVDVDVYCWEDEHPRAVSFVSADGSAARCFIGYNYLSEDMFYGEGNRFVVSGTGWSAETEQDEPYTRTYYYAKGKDESGEQVEGFFYKGKTTEERFTFSFTGDTERYLEKGLHDLGASYSRYNKDTGLTDTVGFSVRVNAAKYDAYADYPIYAYTGKVIKPKFKVYNSDEKKIAASEYTYKMPKNKKMGWYTVTIKFKDKNKYVETITAYYGIGPKAPKLKKVTGRKKGLTVFWKVPTAAQMKNYDGMYIEVSTDKYFLNNYKRIKVSKKAMRYGCKKINKLKKNKKYYVRAYAYKNIKQKGEKFPMYSADSKTLTKKTK